MNKNQIQDFLGETIVSLTPLSGGDIAYSQKIETEQAVYFVKSAWFSQADELFKKEQLGLEELRKTGAIGIPKVIGFFEKDDISYLILEFIESKPANVMDMEAFGRSLAKMHSKTSEDFFGLKTDNFIGKLPQINSIEKSWTKFYVNQRLETQLKMAYDSGKLTKEQIPSANKMMAICDELFGNPQPSVLHGDLWSGNYLISQNGQPYLFDPAVYYGHNEVDMAMTKLFGGFSSAFYGAYHEVIPSHPNQKELVEIYQLYYLLVHLNLFGSSYRNSVVQILKRFFL